MRIIVAFFCKIYRINRYLINKRRFKVFGKKSYIKSSLRIEGYKNIIIGERVSVSYKAWLAAVPLTGEDECRLEIQDGCSIGNFNHIYATKYIKIGKNVMTADKVYISDNLHGYEDISTPIINQPIKQIGIVDIGDGSWLGENVCIIGARIGKNCIVGANSVVSGNYPDYCVIAGNPARIIRKYDLLKGRWI